jgi:hypothetical protein
LLARGQGEVGAEWRARWKASTKTGSPLFEGPVMDWTINQVALVFWSNFYDSIYEHPERPVQKVIDNDDLLDKWVEDQSKKMEDRARKNSSGGSGLKALDHDEVIVFDNELIEELDDEDEDDEEEIIEEYY